MFLTTNTCDGKRDCIKQCPTQAIRFIGGKAFSCLTCGICYKNCPNDAIFKNSYGGYVVDRAKCNGCGICMHNCPIDNIHIEEGTVYGICSRCGVCEEACSSHSRVDGLELTQEKQLQLIKSLKISFPVQNTPKPVKPKKSEVTRAYFGTDINKCIFCGRCAIQCPTEAIKVTMDRDEGICTECRICVDVCPNDSMSKHLVVNQKTCTLCLNCLKNCPHEAISVNDFKIDVNKINQNPIGSIVSCINCGLCADVSLNDSLIRVDGKNRYDPTQDNINLAKSHEEIIEHCPVSTIKEDDKTVIFDCQTGEEYAALNGFCVSCGSCVQACDETNARQYMVASWDGSISDDCISCGICSEVCQKEAITLHRGTISVDLDKCILCENCAVHCPCDAIPRTTMDKKVIDQGFNCIDQTTCLHCGLCFNICSYDAIVQNGDKFEVDDEKCTYCGACKNACPANSFIFERKFKDSREAI